MKAPKCVVSVLGVAACLALGGCSGSNPLTAPHLNQAGSEITSVTPGPLAGAVITSWIDSNEKTMSVMTGNEVAVQHARTGGGPDYPQGSTLSVATWEQAEDERWFGARIPNAPRSVEVLTVSSSAGGKRLFSYRRYEGRPLKRVVDQDATPADERIQFLLSQRAAVMP
ncbi:hypothetical protein [Paludibaculum fermentans]|uniref:hypothetical protein n=1 Tax=Paludibaculum fermentans TaxID=1473598 RepID=UPI003EBA85CC